MIASTAGLLGTVPLTCSVPACGGAAALKGARLVCNPELPPSCSPRHCCALGPLWSCMAVCCLKRYSEAGMWAVLPQGRTSPACWASEHDRVQLLAPRGPASSSPILPGILQPATARPPPRLTPAAESPRCAASVLMRLLASRARIKPPTSAHCFATGMPFEVCRIEPNPSAPN